nr:hypothetical protein BaRGS_028643 [Batillaria attramentaria]
MCVVGFTAVAVLISSLSESQQPTGETTIKLTKNGRIPARKRIEMRLEQAKDTKGRIRLHPDVMQGTQKEYHWWDRYRFGDPGEDETGPKGGDGSPSYLWDVDNWDLIDGNQECDEPRVVIGQHIRHFYPDAKILMTFRHPTPRLYSRFLSRIPRTPQLKNATAEDFHKYVVRGIQMYKDCFVKFSIRQCAYNDTLHTEAFHAMRDTTIKLDKHGRIRLHPDVMQGTQKEYHWWDRYRFGDTEEDDDTGAKEEATSFDEYLQQITGPELKDVENDIITEGHT